MTADEAGTTRKREIPAHRDTADPTVAETPAEPVFADALGGGALVLGDAAEALEMLAHHSGDCVRLLDLDGRILRWNSACELMYGWSAHEVVGKRLPHVPSRDRLRALRNIRDVAASGRVAKSETVQQRADDSLVAVRMVVIPVVDDEGNSAGVLSLTREASSDTRLERQREDFAAIISRQVRDPVSAILGYAQLLHRSEILEDSARRDRTVRSLTDCAEQVARLLDDLMLVYDFDEGRFALDIGPVDLGELVTRVVEQVHSSDRDVLVDFEPELGDIPADGRRLGQAVACLVDNAVRHAPPGTSVGVSVYAVGDEAVIEVVDTGPGIPPAEQPRIFDRFYSAASPDGNQPGVGIGLHLVRVIADAHGGTIAVASVPGAGSTFTLRLPRTAR